MNEGDLIQCNIDDCVSTTNKMTTNSNDDSILIASPPITPSINNNLADNLNQVNSEKCDITPENSKKSDDIDIFSSSTEIMDKISVEEQSISASVLLPEKSVENEVLRIEEVDDSARPAAPLAFTIDFGDTKNNVESQKKYQSMVERFQNRHKRGQSLSKLESPESDKKNSNPQLNKITRPPMSAKLPRKKQSIGTNSESSFSSEQDEQNFNTSKGSVKLRNRDRSVDSNKRHSWGPKTTGTVHNNNNNDFQPPAQHNPPPPIVKSIQQPIVQKNNTPSPIVHKKFTPRSTAMTLALDSTQNKLEFICPAPPLENYKTDRAEDSVSEAGTYTLDGDNYTEEQKAKMNIDKLKNEKLEIIDLDLENVAEPLKEDDDLMMSQTPRKNILEISFYHNEPTNFKPKLSYLEKIKSRVKNIGQKSSSKLAPPDKSVTSPDLGAFTSVTTSGILSLKPTLEHNPKMTRRNSLTKSHIDSSEYVQGISRLNLKCDDDLCDKPVAPRQIALDNNNDCDEIKILNCDNNSSSTNNNVNLGKTIKTASTKNDWIQEWAKYAREYAQNPSNKNAINPSAKQQKINLTSSGNGKMSQSYDFENYYNNKRDNNNIENLSVMTKSSDYSSNYDDEFGHNLDRNNYNTNSNKSTKNNRNLERFNNIGSFEYSSSDTNLKYYDQKLLNNQQQRNDRVRYDYVNRIDDDSNPNHNPRYHNTNNNNNNHNYNSKNYQNQYYGGGTLDSPVNNRPPMSPSKIPSPIHSLSKARGSSRSRSRNGSNTDLNLLPNDTEMYLQKTAAAISTLQNIHRQNSLNNSPQSPSSPVRKISPKMSPNHHYNQHQKHNNQSLGNSGHPNMRSPLRMRSSKSHSNDIRMEHNEYRDDDDDDEDESPVPYYKSLHQRNLSLDGTEVKPKIRNYDARHGIINMNNMSNSYNTDGLNAMLDMNKTHTRHHSYEGMSKNVLFDQTNNEHNAVAMRPSNQLIRTSSNNSSSNKIMLPSTNSPIRRSNSFSTKNSNAPPIKYSSNKLMLNHNINSNHGSNNNNNNNKHNPIKKSASSTSFRKMIGGLVHENDDEMEFYINDDDDLIDDHRYNNLNSSNSDLSDGGEGVEQKEPITNTRYNKAFLMRMEQNKRPNSGNSGNPMMNKQGVIACPNTPELRRRDTTNVRQSFRDRASMPRDSSLSRMKQDLPNLNTTKKSLTSKEPKIQPKYLDISKYKPVQGNHFLKRDESKSYLAQQKEVKRSPSSASVNLNRNDNTRTSNRSIKSAGAKPNPSKKEQAIQKAKEIELAMWKRRASYDPMKAAAEGRKKQEEAKRQAQQSKLCESSMVLRSQSFHSGVTGKTLGQNQMNKFGANDDDQTDENYYNKRWTLTSNESSDDDDDDDEYLINS